MVDSLFRPDERFGNSPPQDSIDDGRTPLGRFVESPSLPDGAPPTLIGGSIRSHAKRSIPTRPPGARLSLPVRLRRPRPRNLETSDSTASAGLDTGAVAPVRFLCG